MMKLEDAAKVMLRAAGQLDRPGTMETPKRFAKAWQEMMSGYSTSIPSMLKCFEDGAEGVDQMVVVKDIPVYSNCEHHMLPFFGHATVAYIPNGKVVGLSKLPRLVNAYSRRLQVQERLTQQVANALNEHVKPSGVGVQLVCRHMCMECRGVCIANSTTVTTALYGAMLDDQSARSEFLAACGRA